MTPWNETKENSNSKGGFSHKFLSTYRSFKKFKNLESSELTFHNLKGFNLKWVKLILILKALIREHVSSAKLLSFGAHGDTELCRLCYKHNPLFSWILPPLFTKYKIRLQQSSNLLFINNRVINTKQWKTPDVLQKGLN